MNLFCNDIVMVSIVFFACNVRGKVPMGGQRGSSVSRQYKNDGILKTGQWHSTVWEEGGFCRKKKDFGKPPCQLLMKSES